MDTMLYEGELKVLEILWTEGEMLAKDLVQMLNLSTNWAKTTSYTTILRCVKKGLIARIGHNFVCQPLITRQEARERETNILSNKMFGGSTDLLLASLLEQKKLTSDQIDLLLTMDEEFARE